MKRHLLIVLILGMVFLAGNVGAKEVHLDIGETYQKGDISITCGKSSIDNFPLTINDCQYWDNYNKRCLFETTTYMYKKLECVEDCQHWDKFNSSCHYKTKCTFYPPQKLFFRTICEKFDDYNKTCLKTKDIKIGRE